MQINVDLDEVFSNLITDIKSLPRRGKLTELELAAMCFKIIDCAGDYDQMVEVYRLIPTISPAFYDAVIEAKE